MGQFLSRIQENIRLSIKLNGNDIHKWPFLTSGWCKGCFKTSPAKNKITFTVTLIILTQTDNYKIKHSLQSSQNI